MQTFTIKQTTAQLSVIDACIDGAVFNDVKLSKASFFDVAMDGVTIENANLSDLEIKNAQIGGAYIHDIGLPPAGHPRHDPNIRMRPVRFEDCYLAGSTITNCNLSNVSITDCNLTGMTIDGISVQELLALYNKRQ